MPYPEDGRCVKSEYESEHGDRMCGLDDMELETSNDDKRDVKPFGAILFTK